jgi:hypothetical protein
MMAIFQSPKNMNQNSKRTAKIDFRSCPNETERKLRMLVMDSRLQHLISAKSTAGSNANDSIGCKTHDGIVGIIANGFEIEVLRGMV